MANELLLINPRKRRGKRRMSAKQRRYFGGGRKRRHYSKRRSRRRNPVALLNPRRRHSRKRYSLARRHIMRHRRRNPAVSMGGLTRFVQAGATGAIGAVAVDVIMGYAGDYLPDTVKSPVSATGGINPFYFLSKGAGAVILGIVGRKFLKLGGIAEKMAEGSLVVTLHDAITMLLPATVKLGYMNPGYIASKRARDSTGYVDTLSGVGAYVHEGGDYEDAQSGRMGEYIH